MNLDASLAGLAAIKFKKNIDNSVLCIYNAVYPINHIKIIGIDFERRRK